MARAVNFRGIVLGAPLSFPNNENGFHALLQWILHLQSSYNLTQTVVGMEPTGHYWHNVSRWLSNRNCEVVLLNPHLVKKNKENRDNTPSKSDIKDTLVIADMVKNGYYAFVRSTSEEFEELLVLMANRDFIVKRLVSSINQINRWVDIVFPELRQVFKNITCVGSLATLRLFPTPAELRELMPQDIISQWKTIPRWLPDRTL